MKAYSFFVEMERQDTRKQFALLAEQLSADQDIREVKWLGSWNDRIED
jgi:prephenate dehydratase